MSVLSLVLDSRSIARSFVQEKCIVALDEAEQDCGRQMGAVNNNYRLTKRNFCVWSISELDFTMSIFIHVETEAPKSCFLAKK
jgi:hypothetical protein